MEAVHSTGVLWTTRLSVGQQVRKEGQMDPTALLSQSAWAFKVCVCCRQAVRGQTQQNKSVGVVLFEAGARNESLRGLTDSVLSSLCFSSFWSFQWSGRWYLFRLQSISLTFPTNCISDRVLFLKYEINVADAASQMSSSAICESLSKRCSAMTSMQPFPRVKRFPLSHWSGNKKKKEERTSIHETSPHWRSHESCTNLMGICAAPEHVIFCGTWCFVQYSL